MKNTLTQMLTSTGLFADPDAEQTPSPAPKSVPSFVSMESVGSVSTGVPSNYTQIVTDKLQQKIMSANPVYAKYLEKYFALEGVPFPETKLRVQAALATAGLTAKEVIDVLQQDFLSVLKGEKDTFDTEIRTSQDVIIKESDDQMGKLAIQKQSLEQQLSSVNAEMQSLGDKKVKHMTELSEKRSIFNGVYESLNSQIKTTISNLSLLK